MIHPLAVIGEPPEHRDHEGAGIPPVIDPSATVGAYCTIDAGMVTGTRIGRGAWLMKGCHVGHDAEIGADAELAPHCVVGGHVRLGARVRAGLNASFKPFVQVGDDARIGMGAVVIHDVPAGETWAGNPARRIHAAPAAPMQDDEWVAWWDALHKAHPETTRQG